MIETGVLKIHHTLQLKQQRLSREVTVLTGRFYDSKTATGNYQDRRSERVGLCDYFRRTGSPASKIKT